MTLTNLHHRDHILGDQQGSVLIESAFVLLTTVVLLLGVFNFAIALFGYCNVTYSARAAARYASLHSSSSLAPATAASIQAVVMPYLVGAKSGAYSINTTYSGANTIGKTVKVGVSITYNLNIPLPAAHNITVSSVIQRTITR